MRTPSLPLCPPRPSTACCWACGWRRARSGAPTRAASPCWTCSSRSSRCDPAPDPGKRGDASRCWPGLPEKPGLCAWQLEQVTQEVSSGARGRLMLMLMINAQDKCRCSCRLCLQLCSCSHSAHPGPSQEFRTPSGKEFAKEFSPVLNGVVAFLVSCRPLAISMGNAIKARGAGRRASGQQGAGGDEAGPQRHLPTAAIPLPFDRSRLSRRRWRR